jgi:hypothetical protein
VDLGGYELEIIGLKLIPEFVCETGFLGSVTRIFGPGCHNKYILKEIIRGKNVE